MSAWGQSFKAGSWRSGAWRDFGGDVGAPVSSGGSAGRAPRRPEMAQKRRDEDDLLILVLL